MRGYIAQRPLMARSPYVRIRALALGPPCLAASLPKPSLPRPLPAVCQWVGATAYSAPLRPLSLSPHRFADLSNTELRALFGRCQLVHFPKGSVVLRESSCGTSYYLLIQGRLFAASKRRAFDVLLLPGTSFGETALVPNLRMRREATVAALEDSWCLRMHAGMLEGVPKPAVDELHKIYYAKMLASTRWFEVLVPTKLLEVAACMVFETLPPSRAVFHQGDAADKMWASRPATPPVLPPPPRAPAL